MLGDATLAHLCAATYTSPASLPVRASGVYICLTETDDYIVVAFRGSITPEDWWHDFDAFAISVRHHPQLGFCHAGFIRAAESVLPMVRKTVRGKAFYLTGHSYGGALAVGVGALLILDGLKAEKIMTLGAPRVGMWKFARVLSVIKELPQYRRGNDPVPDVPFFIPPLFSYRVTRAPLIEIGKPQADAFSCHHIAGYVEDVTGAVQ